LDQDILLENVETVKKFIKDAFPTTGIKGVYLAGGAARHETRCKSMTYNPLQINDLALLICKELSIWARIGHTILVMTKGGAK
jgi:hypothetical protein